METYGRYTPHKSNHYITYNANKTIIVVMFTVWMIHRHFSGQAAFVFLTEHLSVSLSRCVIGCPIPIPPHLCEDLPACQHTVLIW